MKQIIAPLIILVVIGVGIFAFTKHPILSANQDEKATKAAMNQAAAIQAVISNKTANGSQAASAALAVGATSTSSATTTQRAIEAQHLLNAVQGVLGQLDYKVSNQTAAGTK